MHRARRLAACALASAIVAGGACVLPACSADDGKPIGPFVVLPEGGADARIATGDLLDVCGIDSDCKSGHCFVGGKQSACSLLCTPANAPTVCAPPAFNGVCNMRGFCKPP